MKQINTDFTFIILLCVFMCITYPILKTENHDSGCTKEITQTLLNKFKHTSISHLFVDIATLLFLYELEKTMGSHGFFILFIVSLFLISIFETTLVNVYPQVKCTPGLFSVFVAIGTFDTLKSVSNTYIYPGIGLVVSIIVNMIYNNDFEYINDYIGFFVGLLLSLPC